MSPLLNIQCIIYVFLNSKSLSQQVQVNNANSAFFLINRLISQGFQSGSIGPGGPGGPYRSYGPGVPDGQGCQGVRGSGWSCGDVVMWSCGQVVMWSGGQVVQMVRWSGRFMCCDGQDGPSGPDDSCGPYGPGDQASQGGPGGQVVRW